MPEPGAYIRDERPDRTSVLTPTSAFSRTFTFGQPGIPASQVEMQIQFPDGRFYTSIFGLGATRALNVELIGSAVEKQLALKALLDPAFFSFLGSGTWANPLFLL